jgi:two-component system, cell cycle sensor histidine kinase and response regulator CckA
MAHVACEAGGAAILLVEDDVDVRRITRRILNLAGYAVIEAGNGHEALQAVEHHAGRIDLVLTDAVMPELGGRELVGRLRSVHPDLPVLVMSGYPLDRVHHDFGRAAFLPKPFGSRELLAGVRQALGLPQRAAWLPERPSLAS